LPDHRKFNRRPRTERIAEICRAARVAFAENGYEGAVIADIAAAAGIAEGTIYKLFDSKRDLLHAVIADWYGSFVADLDRQLASLNDPAQKLRFLIWHHLTVINTDPALCRVFFREIRAYDGYRGSSMYELNRTYTAFTVQVIEEGVASGAFRADVPVAMVRDAVFGGLEHYTWRFLAGREQLDVERTTQLFWQFVVRGIAADPTPDTNPESRLEAVVERLESVAERIGTGRD
tara:strand:+ start:14724 stop:15422 length:699 start_codon:yes stop_codon:yes gene_type:complete